MRVEWVACHEIASLDELAATIALTCSFPLKFSAINNPTKLFFVPAFSSTSKKHHET
jgi:hypothetical protein